MKEKIHLGAIYIIDDFTGIDISALPKQTDGRNIIYIQETKRKDSYAKKLLDKFFREKK